MAPKERTLLEEQCGYAYNRMNQLYTSSIGISLYHYENLSEVVSDEMVRGNPEKLSPQRLQEGQKISEMLSSLVGEEFGKLKDDILAICNAANDLQMKMSRSFFPDRGQKKVAPAYDEWNRQVKKLSVAIEELKEKFVPVEAEFEKRYQSLPQPTTMEELRVERTAKLLGGRIINGFASQMRTASRMALDASAALEHAKSLDKGRSK